MTHLVSREVSAVTAIVRIASGDSWRTAGLGPPRRRPPQTSQWSTCGRRRELSAGVSRPSQPSSIALSDSHSRRCERATTSTAAHCSRWSRARVKALETVSRDTPRTNAHSVTSRPCQAMTMRSRSAGSRPPSAARNSARTSSASPPVASGLASSPAPGRCPPPRRGMPPRRRMPPCPRRPPRRKAARAAAGRQPRSRWAGSRPRRLPARRRSPAGTHCGRRRTATAGAGSRRASRRAGTR